MQHTFHLKGALKNKPFNIDVSIKGEFTKAEVEFLLQRSIRDTLGSTLTPPKLSRIKPMEAPIKPFTTYRYYTKKGERLAIFALPNNGRITSIYVLKCSTHDQFHKKIARTAFREYMENNKQHKDYHFQEIPVDMEANYISFLSFCRKNYYLRVPQLVPIYSLIKL